MSALRGKLPRAILLVVLLGLSWIVYFLITRPNEHAPLADEWLLTVSLAVVVLRRIKEEAAPA